MKNIIEFVHSLVMGIAFFALFWAIFFVLNSLLHLNEVFQYNEEPCPFEYFIFALMIIYTNFNHLVIVKERDKAAEELNKRISVEGECKKKMDEYNKKADDINACLKYFKAAIGKEIPERSKRTPVFDFLNRRNWEEDIVEETKRYFNSFLEAFKEKKNEYAASTIKLSRSMNDMAKRLLSEIEVQVEITPTESSSIKEFEAIFELYLSSLRLERNKIKREKDSLKRILYSKFPFSYIASLRADAEVSVFDATRRYLLSKPHPAQEKTAEQTKKLKEETRRHIAAYKEILYKYELLLAQFPELKRYVDDYEDLKSMPGGISVGNAEIYDDETKAWLSKEEYKNLPEDERNQLALDRYINGHNKSKNQIGRDYELYIGSRFREKGWNVVQFGVEKKLKDLGRDLIVSKIREDGLADVRIVQCKMWSKEKEIHENAICQLFGTTVQYIIENNMIFKEANERVRPLFVTTTDLSETAKKFANALGVQVKIVQMEDFPRIKCNISKDGKKIYHLPFDQQYNSTVIDYNKDEFYASTVKEAVSKGFRRAFRHNGN